jgi:hypothetical protein
MRWICYHCENRGTIKQGSHLTEHNSHSLTTPSLTGILRKAAGNSNPVGRGSGTAVDVPWAMERGVHEPHVERWSAFSRWDMFTLESCKLWVWQRCPLLVQAPGKLPRRAELSPSQLGHRCHQIPGIIRIREAVSHLHGKLYMFEILCMPSESCGD